MTDLNDCRKTPLYNLHVEHGGKMVPFAGYAMPVQYSLGVLKEHIHTRTSAGLFDVSHMGQSFVRSRNGDDPALALEKVMPGLLNSLKPGKMRYTLLLNEQGGIEDDLIVTRSHEPDGTIFMVVNAAFKDKDYDLIEAAVGDNITIEPLEDRALLALQGPRAEEILCRLAPEVADLKFMEATAVTLEGVVCWVSRSGYTGEDGFEISIPEDEAENFARRLLAFDEVELIGLGARDSLRLEAGLCLSGQDFDSNITPVEANIGFALSKKRLESSNYYGIDTIKSQKSSGVSKLRVGLVLEGRAPARGGTTIMDGEGENAVEIGHVTSGSFGPSVERPVAMGYVAAPHFEVGNTVYLDIRGKRYPAQISPMPFVKQNYKR